VVEVLRWSSIVAVWGRVVAGGGRCVAGVVMVTRRAGVVRIVDGGLSGCCCGGRRRGSGIFSGVELVCWGCEVQVGFLLMICLQVCSGEWYEVHLRINAFPCYSSNPLIRTTSKTHINHNISIFNNITTSL